MNTTALDRAIEAAGSQSELAVQITRAAKASRDPKIRRRRFKQQHVSWWMTKSGGNVPAEVAPLIETATGISKHELRPDVFGKAAA